MTELKKGPLGQRRGRGARERILEAAGRLFREHGINNTGMDQLCSTAQVSKRTAYQHFGSKDALVVEYLREADPDAVLTAAERSTLTPREQLMALFDRPWDPSDEPPPLCPFIGAAVEIADPEHPARLRARDYKRSVAAELAEIASAAGVADPELLGEQLALLHDGSSVRSRALNTNTVGTAALIAAKLVDEALAEAERRGGASNVPASI